jgi:hypothetical protein
MPTEPTEEQPQPNGESHEARSAQLAFVVGYKDREETSELGLPEDVISRVAFEAESRGMGIDELIGALRAAAMEKDLLQLILDRTFPISGAEPADCGSKSETRRKLK